MSPHHSRRRPNAAARSGFSLVELMAVVAIISLLIALLLPAVQSVRTRANLARVAVDIKGLETGIATFKTEFGSEPPSSITLYETPAGWMSASPSDKSKIRKLWPQFDFTGAATRPPGSGWDINGDGNKTGSLTLSGSECLVFFLSGVCATNFVDAAGNSSGMGTVTEWTPLGFSKNPRNPFERAGGTRIGPMTELDASRLVDVFPLPSGGNGMPELLDPLPSQSRPYLYASSYEGKGYDWMDLGQARGSSTEWGHVYFQKLGLGAMPALPEPQIPAGSVPWNKTGYQIISPGNDGEYGIGGEFTVDESYELTGARVNERDNITNFSGGPLNN